MSKFTKLLEKVQQGGVPAEKEVKKEPFPWDEIEMMEDRSEEWWRGIPCIKKTEPDSDVVTHHFPNSLIADQYRMLVSNLKNDIIKSGTKVIVVSSSVRGEGKTVTTANLAYVLAENREDRVAVVDADLRRGRLAERLGFGKGRFGLANFLASDSKRSPKEMMMRNSLDNLIVIPRGDATDNPSQLLSSNKFRMLLAQLRNCFDYVLIDSPPIMAAADAGMISREVDGTIMVIQLGRTPKNVIAHSNLLFKQSGATLLGYVLTNVDSVFERYGYYYGYGYTGREKKQPRKFRRQFKVALRKTGSAVHGLENRFQHWWDRKVLKISPETRIPLDRKEGV